LITKRERSRQSRDRSLSADAGNKSVDDLMP
jgi:hypothetical protein